MPSCLSALRAVFASLAVLGPALLFSAVAAAQETYSQLGEPSRYGAPAQIGAPAQGESPAQIGAPAQQGAATPSTSLELFQELPAPEDEDAAVRTGADLERAHRWVDA